MLRQPRGMGSLGPGAKAAPATLSACSLPVLLPPGREKSRQTAPLAYPADHSQSENAGSLLHEAAAFKGFWRTWMQGRILEGEQRLCCPVFAAIQSISFVNWVAWFISLDITPLPKANTLKHAYVPQEENGGASGCENRQRMCIIAGRASWFCQLGRSVCSP